MTTTNNMLSIPFRMLLMVKLKPPLFLLLALFQFLLGCYVMKPSTSLPRSPFNSF